jgi:hypothetical protein
MDTVEIYSPVNDRTLAQFSFNNEMTICDLKSHICKTHNIPVEQQKIKAMIPYQETTYPSENLLDTAKVKDVVIHFQTKVFALMY